jgi:hypothetical protein
MTEKQIFEKALRPLETMGPKFVSVETGGHAIGFPDVFYSYATTSGVIELKASTRQRGGIVIPYRPGQRAFLVEHGKRSDYVFLLFWYAGTFYLLNDFRDIFESEEEMEAVCLWQGKELNKKFLGYL